MTLKSILCRDHGGHFEIEAKRGRPPVRCSEDNPCDRAPKAASKRRVAEAIQKPGIQAAIQKLTLSQWQAAAKNAGFGKATIARLKTPGQFRQLLGLEAGELPAGVTPKARAANEVASVTAERLEAAEAGSPTPTARKPRQRASKAAPAPVEERVNPSIPKAHAARALLEPQGWKVTGRASFEGEEAHASILAMRGEEQLHMVWVDGGLVAQQYSMWNMETPAKNNTPDHKLPFDPDEMTDAELVRAISGMKVTWWNRIGQMTENAIVSKDRVQVQHLYDGKGDETPADRVITFTDMGGDGFRSFRVGALLKIG